MAKEDHAKLVDMIPPSDPEVSKSINQVAMQ